MKKLESAVIRFCGDSGDGMQITGSQFSSTSALMGNDLSTFPDFPAEIRAPQGTVAGISGFQVHFGSKEVSTPGDAPDVMIAMNPAALKANLHTIKKGGTIIINLDAFTERNIQKAGYEKTPIGTPVLDDYQVIEAPITSQTLEALKDLELDSKAKSRCKNFYALGMTYFMFNRDVKTTENWLQKKFGKKPILADANVLALKAGYNFADTLEITISSYSVATASIEPGKYRHINGNTAVAWGLIQAAEAANLELFLGSYPITPATDILHELSKYKHFGVKTFQAEDEIAGICSAIGASFGGALALTTSSGPGIALKGEGLGLATMLELPLVIINVQRGGPSTGLPTKTEQSDLNLALYGRNGECPMIVIAASRPNDCFHMAFEAARLALTHMTPVMLLTDGYIANGAEPWKIPDLKQYAKIKTRLVTKELKEGEVYYPYKRDPKTLARTWAPPGIPGHEHRVGGLEKAQETGNVSYDPVNHETMCHIRQEKVDLVANDIPEQDVEGKKSGDVLVISWGGTYGAVHSAVKELQEQKLKVSLTHIKYLSPLPKNLGKLIKSFKKVIIPELNMGQLKSYLDAKYHIESVAYNKLQGLPFTVAELRDFIKKEAKKIK